MFEQLEHKLSQLMADVRLEQLAKQAPRVLVLQHDLAERLHKGETSMIVAPAADAEEDQPAKLLVADAAFVYGVAELEKPRSMSLAEFRREEDKHGIADDFRKQWWPRSRRLYGYPVEKFVKLDPPLHWLPDSLPLPEPRFSTWPDEKVLKGVDLQPAIDLATLLTAAADNLEPVAASTIKLCLPLDESREVLILAPQILRKAAESLHKLEELQGSSYNAAVTSSGGPFGAVDEALGRLDKAELPVLKRHEPAAWLELAKQALEAIIKLRPRMDSESLRDPEAVAKMAPGEYGTERVVCPSCGEEYDVAVEVLTAITEMECPVCGEYFAPSANPAPQDVDTFRPLDSQEAKEMQTKELLRRREITSATLEHMKKLDDAKRGEMKHSIDDVKLTLNAIELELARREELMAIYEEKVKPYRVLEGEEKRMAGVVQAHFIGKKAHIDLRYDAGDHLLGLELSAQRASWSRLIKDLDEAKKIATGFDPAGSAWNRTIKRSRVPVAFKDPEPRNWLDVEAEEFAMGAVGASELHPGYVVKLADPSVTLGMRDEGMQEYFIENGDSFSGLLTAKCKDDIWLASYSSSSMPHVLRKPAVKAGKVPPQGWSCLPHNVKKVVPKQYRYWLEDSEEKRIEMRDALVDSGFITPETIRLVDGEFHVVKVTYEIYKPSADEQCSIEMAKEQRVQELLKRLQSMLGGPAAEEVGRGIGIIPTQPACQPTDQDPGCQQKDSEIETEILKRFKENRKFRIRSLAKSDEERYTFGEVLVPGEFDAHEDAYSETDVRKAFEYFVEEAAATGLMHQEPLETDQLFILDNYTALTDFEYDGRVVKKGTWLMGARVLDDELWQAIKDEKFTGWSIEGSAIAHFIEDDVDPESLES